MDPIEDQHTAMRPDAAESPDTDQATSGIKGKITEAIDAVKQRIDDYHDHVGEPL